MSNLRQLELLQYNRSKLTLLDDGPGCENCLCQLYVSIFGRGIGRLDVQSSGYLCLLVSPPF